MDASQRLEIQALNSRWPITQETRRQIIERLCRIVSDPVAPPRDIIAAAKALMAADAANQKIEEAETDERRRARLLELAKSLPIGELARLAVSTGIIDATARASE